MIKSEPNPYRNPYYGNLVLFIVPPYGSPLDFGGTIFLKGPKLWELWYIPYYG